MRLTYHLVKIVVESLQFGIATRKVSVVAVILIGFLLIALAFAAQTAAPLAIYPFA